MNANELMLGDWVMDGDMPARVTSITCDGIVETTRRISNIEVIEPIPLTPEILEKNGWAITDTFYERPQRYDLRINEDCIAWFRKRKRFLIWADSRKREICRTYIRTYDITFVHELQHAIRLCGIEKEIVL